ncbi:MAG: hypothetical protein KDB48_02355 [Solirubrobacterales bacterium]|nr:hypothetical protein [Solirubrobacterales bacterium]HMT05631.1 hypothetical protein [Solirubrobacterales bacterium]
MQAPDRFSISDTLQAMRTEFEENRALVLRITLLFSVLAAALTLLDLTGPIGFAVSAGMLVLLGATYGGLITTVVCVPGQPDGIAELWGNVKPVLARLIWVTLITAAVAILGFFALIVPGLIIVTIWSVGGQVIVVERPGVQTALGRSFELVRGNGFRVFGYLLLLGLLAAVLSILALLITIPFGDGILRTILNSFLSNLVTAPVVAIGSAVLYNALSRPQEEPADPAA